MAENPQIRFTTDLGPMLFELFEDVAPNTVANIITLAEDGFYEGMDFHRVIPNFMAQGGCPHSKGGTGGSPGTGGPGYQIKCECSKDLSHDVPGLLSMANAGKDTNGSQFFLTFVPCEYLDGKHTVFGKITEGQDVLKELEKIGTPSGRAKTSIKFNVEVVSKRDHEYTVTKR